MSRPQVSNGQIAIFTDVACPWSTVVIARLLRVRTELGLDGRVRLDHRCFLLEEVNQAPTSRRVVDTEIPVAGACEPDLGWKPWQADPSRWPVSTALANEAVYAAKEQSPRAAEELDFALRMALFRDSRCISLRHEILAVAGDCTGVDADALGAALDDGRARGPMLRDLRQHRDAVRASPHLFLPDGSDVANPGLSVRWVGDEGAGFPVVERDQPEVIAELLRAAAATG